MSARPATRTIARRCLEILDQMTGQLLASRGDAAADQARQDRIRADLTRLVHLALHDRGNPDVVARIRDCYRRCAVDIDDTAVLRQARGVIKGELRKAGIDAAIPGLDGELDVATIILTTRLTIQRMGGSSSATSAPGPALDRKRHDGTAKQRTRPAAEEPPPPAPHTVRTTKPATTRRSAATPAQMQAAFDGVVDATLARIRASGRSIERPDYLAAVYNDPAGKERLVAAITDALPHTNRAVLAQAIDGFFRNGFKGHYIERTDRQGHRRAHRR